MHIHTMKTVLTVGTALYMFSNIYCDLLIFILSEYILSIFYLKYILSIKVSFEKINKQQSFET